MCDAGARRMRVAFFQFYPPTLWARGGGETQLAKTREALERLGVSVGLFDIWAPDKSFDILHVFGSSYELSSFVETAKRSGLSVVVSAIAYSVKPAWQWKLAKYTEWLLPAPTVYRLRQRIYTFADRIVVASASEARQLKQGFNVDNSKFRVISHGIDADRFRLVDPSMFLQKYGLKDFVLQVGRINRHKGQARLIRALEGTGLNVVFIGPLDYTDPSGVAEFEQLVKRYRWVHYLGVIDHEDPILPAAYAAARVHVLPSVSESLGLVTLEAIAAGTAAVSGAYPAIREYLGDQIHYCNPRSIDSIREAVLQAYQLGPKQGAREYTLNNLTWDHVARKLVELYKELTN